MSDDSHIYREYDWFVDARFDKAVVVDAYSFNCFIFNFPLSEFNEHVTLKKDGIHIIGSFVQFPDFRALCKEEGYILLPVTKAALCSLKEYIDKEIPGWSERSKPDSSNMNGLPRYMQHAFDILYVA